jgi:curli production assembly/transport component CsgF
MYRKTLIVIVACAQLIGTAAAEELKYMPVNPNFGGSPFNGSTLLAEASAQRGQAPSKKRNSAEEFAESVRSAILSRVSREISDAILGENAKDSGSFTIGDTDVDFHREGPNVVINIKEPGSGETTITMPVPTY